MKILLVNTYDIGGAATACKRLHLELLDNGMDSKIILKYKTQALSESFQFKQKIPALSFSEKIQRKILRILKELKLYSVKPKEKEQEIPFLRKRPRGLEMSSLPYSNLDITQSELYKEADIINLHWVANFLDYKSFFQKNTKPVVWTLHDMNPFLGIDHYSEDYLGMDENGKPLARLIANEEQQINIKIESYKKECIKNAKNLTVVAPSKWLANQAQKSDIFSNREIRIIPHSLNEKVFAPRDQKASREILNLPIDKKIILFVADNITNQRKGFEYLQKALQNFDSDKIILGAIGKGGDEITQKNLIKLGQIMDERLLSVAYSASDVFVIPSIMDNLPNTVIESLMCGTPVIGFPVGGITDMVIHRENGLLTEEISVKALVSSIQEFLDKSEMFDRNYIRQEALKKYSKNVQANRYKSLFENILKVEKN